MIKMNARILVFLLVCITSRLNAGTVEKTFYFDQYAIGRNGDFQTIRFGNTLLSGIPGEPSLPWHQVVLALPPGEAAVSMEVTWEEETPVPGFYVLYPQQAVSPVSEGIKGDFLQNKALYGRNAAYPPTAQGRLLTQYLNGFAMALSSFTPVRYNPALGKLSYFGKVTVKVNTVTDPQSGESLRCLPFSGKVRDRVRNFAQNPEMIGMYPEKDAPQTTYQYLIICPPGFKSKFQQLTGMYNAKGIATKITDTDSISTYGTGWDLNEKIRNFIIGQYQQCGVEYVLLAGNPPLVPCRGFYCYVDSEPDYTDFNIPADLYFSGVDGTYDANGNHIYGEVADNPDLLPDLSVGRFTVNDTAELRRMIRKTVSYLTNPVLGEMNKPFLVAEYLFYNPLTFGGDYMDLLVDDHTDNGYFTYGIPSAANTIVTLYDTLITANPFAYWSWSSTLLLARLNQGKSIVHHLGHSNTTYMMRLSMGQITNANFAGVNGTTHNYEILYTQGCYPGAFDAVGGCIAARCVTIDNFLVAGVFNSRYGWFNQGTTDGPSQHLEREFVSAMYNDTIQEKHLGTAHMISKIETAPWISLPGEFEPGAQRWVHYDCNVFGDPALEIWTAEPTLFSTATWTGAVDTNWNNPGNWSPAVVPTSLYNLTIAPSGNPPAIATGSAAVCHNLTIQAGATLAIPAGKSITVYGTVTLAP